MTRDDLEGPEFRDTYTEAVARLIEAKRETANRHPRRSRPTSRASWST
jgi:non-homologous end joining protein Ku